MKDSSNIIYTDTGMKSFNNGTQRFIEGDRKYSNNFTLASRTAAFTPAALPALAGWYDGADASTIIASGGLINQWNDKSPVNNHLIKTADANRLTYVPTSRNGLNSVVANAFSCSMFASLGSWGLQASGYYIFAVMSAKPNPDNGTSLLGKNTSGNATFLVATNGDFLSALQTSALVVIIPSPPGSRNDSIHTVAELQNGTALTLNFDAITGSTAGSLANLSIGLGIYAQGAQGFFGTVCEIIIGNAVLNTAQISTVTTYLRNKWGTP